MKNYIRSSISIVVLLLSNLVSIILASYVLNVEEYATFSIILSYINICTAVLAMGSQNFINKYYFSDDYKSRPGNIFQFTLFNAAPLGVIIFMYLRYIAPEQNAFGIFICVIINFFLVVMSSFARIKGFIITSQVILKIIFNVFVGLFLILIYLETIEINTINVFIFAFALSFMIAHLIAIQKNIVHASWYSLSYARLKLDRKTLKVYYAIGFISLIQVAFKNIDIILLDAHVSNVVVAHYSLVLKLSHLITLSLAISNLVIVPALSEQLNQGRFREAKMLLSRSRMVSFGVALPIFVVLVFYHGNITATLLGDDKILQSPTAIILFVATLINVSFGSIGLFVNLAGHQKEFLILLTSLIAIHIISANIVIPLFGEVGMALVTLFTYIALNVGLLVTIRTKHAK